MYMYIDLNNKMSCSCIDRLISAVFRLCEVEKNAATAKLVDALSPQVTSSMMWFLRRWLKSYLLPDENYYVEVRP